MTSDSERGPERRVSIGKTWAIFVVVAVAVLIGLLLLKRISPPGTTRVTDLILNGGNLREAKLCHPVTLMVIYQHEKQIPGVNGSMAYEGKATYVFKNTLPIPVKLAFPPLGFISSGSVPIAPGTDVVDYMPSFCKEKRIVELKPGGELRFEEEGYVIFDALPRDGEPCVQFVFGKPADVKGDHFLVDAVQGVGSFKPIKLPVK